MQTKTANLKRTYGVPIAAIAAIVLVIFLSNRPASTSNGLPVIESDAQYNDALGEVSKTSRTAVGKFNIGQELDPTDRETALRDAKIFDNMDAYRPDMAAGYFTAGLLYYLGGDSATAEERLSQSIKDGPLLNNLKSFEDKSKAEAVQADCHHMLSLICFDRHDYVTAIEQATEAIQHLDSRESYYVARAQAEVQVKKVPAAQEDLAKALKINPNYAPATRLMKFLNQ